MVSKRYYGGTSAIMLSTAQHSATRTRTLLLVGCDFATRDAAGFARIAPLRMQGARVGMLKPLVIDLAAC